MRIRTDGKHARRNDTIEAAADFWGCNETTALVKSAEFDTQRGIQDVFGGSRTCFS